MLGRKYGFFGFMSLVICGLLLFVDVVVEVFGIDYDVCVCVFGWFDGIVLVVSLCVV